MTPDDLKLVREIADLEKGQLPDRWRSLVQVVKDGKRLLALFTESEVQARYWHHFAHAHLTDNPICNRRNHTFKEFETQVRKEWSNP